MSKTMTLPKIGVNMTEVIVAEWFVKPGDRIKKGDAIFIGETDKAAQDIFATESGIVGKILVEEGAKVQINEPIILLLDEDESVTDMVQTANAEPLVEKDMNIKEKATYVPPETQGDRIRISPLARKMAAENNISLGMLTPSEEGKRIVKDDVIRYLSGMKAAAGPRITGKPNIDDGDVLDIVPMSNIRKIIARRMSESNLEKPYAALTLSAEVDEIVRLRNRHKERGIKISYNDILVKIVAGALSEHRIMNSVLDGETIKLMKHINIGVAIDNEKGLVVPVVRDADKKSIVEISDDLREKVQSVKENRTDPEELSGGTFTITNLGMFEIEQFTPIINPPECCILSVGAMKKEFVPDEDNNPKVVTAMKLTLAFDHRIVDGAPAARFLQSIKHYVEYPEMLL